MKPFLFLIILLIGCTSIEKEMPNIVDIDVLMCQVDDCKEKFLSMIESSEEIYCALHDVGSEGIKQSLIEKSIDSDVRIVIDDDYSDKFKQPFVKTDTRFQITHNKFCIFDRNIVFTGSVNPTERGMMHNDNNLIIIESPKLALNYLAEFSELWRGEFGLNGDGDTPWPVIRDKNITIENYFCPEDHCTWHIIDTLSKAKTQIRFMAFSFTSEIISDKLNVLSEDGIDVEGIMERTLISSYSRFSKMNNSFPVHLDNRKYFMHHKVFIIDDNIVITGSMNPTESGESRNDENLLVIHNEDVTKIYIEEFTRIKQAIVNYSLDETPHKYGTNHPKSKSSSS